MASYACSFIMHLISWTMVGVPIDRGVEIPINVWTDISLRRGSHPSSMDERGHKVQYAGTKHTSQRKGPYPMSGHPPNRSGGKRALWNSSPSRRSVRDDMEKKIEILGSVVL